MPRISVASPAIRIFNSCDKKSAIAELNKHLVKNPDDAFAMAYRAKSNAILGNVAAANSDYREAIKMAANDADRHYFIASYAQTAGELQVAEHEAKAAANDNRNFGEPWSIIGNIKLREKQYDEALKAFDRAIQNDAIDSNWNYLNMGMYYESTGDYKKAMQMYDKAIGHCDTFTKAYLLKGLLARNRFGDQDTYIECLKKAETLNPGLTGQYLENAGDSNSTKFVLGGVLVDENKLFAHYITDIAYSNDNCGFAFSYTDPGSVFKNTYRFFVDIGLKLSREQLDHVFGEVFKVAERAQESGEPFEEMFETALRTSSSGKLTKSKAGSTVRYNVSPSWWGGILSGGGEGGRGGGGGEDGGDDPYKRDYFKIYTQLLKEGRGKTNLFELMKLSSTQKLELISNDNMKGASKSLRLGTKFYNFEELRGDNVMLDGKRYNKELWFCKSDGQHGGVQFKLFIKSSSTFHFVCSTDEFGQPALAKTESLEGLTFSDNKVKRIN